MSALYKRSNALWPTLIRRRWTGALWAPLVEGARRRHLAFASERRLSSRSCWSARGHSRARWANCATLPAGMRRGLLFALIAFSAPANAACPVGTVITVDNDTPASGYSEEKPANWVSHSVEACLGTYRYLSQYVGDGSRKGKAIWQPKIAVSGNYE